MMPCESLFTDKEFLDRKDKNKHWNYFTNKGPKGNPELMGWLQQKFPIPCAFLWDMDEE